MKAVVIGAGSAEQDVAATLLNDRNFQVAGFTDKDTKLKGGKVLGIEIIGTHFYLVDL